MENETLSPESGAALRQQVFDSICALLPGVLGQELPELSGETKLMAELGMRSASMLELLLAIEDELGIQIDVEDIDEGGMSSVGELADFIATHTIAEEG
jgi:acyl carrier protein